MIEEMMRHHLMQEPPKFPLDQSDLMGCIPLLETNICMNTFYAM